MENKKIILALFAFAVLLAFSNVAMASPDAFDSVILQNGTIIGGSSTGATGTLRVAPVVAGLKNFTIRGVYYNTSAGVWARATLAGISGNSSCTNNNCNHTTTIRGAMGVTFTLPADVTRMHLRVGQNSTATGYVNESVILTIDSAAPTFTLSPASSFVQTRANRTINITIVTNENASSVWAVINGVNYSSLSNSGDTTWKQSVALTSDGQVSFYGRAYDYASDGANGATSAIRNFQLNTGRTRRVSEVQSQVTPTGTGTLGRLALAGLIVWLLYLIFAKKGR